MKSVEIIPTSLKGSINIPPSKSICHRAIIAAALAKGSSVINNLVLSDDILATINAVQALGANVTINQGKAYVDGTDFSRTSNKAIDCKESGSTLRFIMPLGLLTGNSIEFVGSGNLGSRPLEPYIDIFNEQGIEYSGTKLPMTVKGKLKPGSFGLRGDISSQFITGLMFALPTLQGDSVINVTTSLESKAYIDLTIDTLKSFGIRIENDNYKCFHIKGRQSYIPAQYAVEGDYSQAAFWVAAGILGSHVACTGLGPYSKQADKAFIDIMNDCGAEIHTADNSVITERSRLKAFNADVSQCPDIAPILAVVAAVAEGTSRISGAYRLRLKECDRLKAIATELGKLGAGILEGEDYLVINGKNSLCGGVVDSWGDHRIAMALSVASIRCTSPLIINNSSVISKSYPDFFKDFASLGGIVNERSLG